jgi:hypothetical protein
MQMCRLSPKDTIVMSTLRNFVLALLLSFPLCFAFAQDTAAAIAAIQTALRARQYDEALAIAEASLLSHTDSTGDCLIHEGR